MNSTNHELAATPMHSHLHDLAVDPYRDQRDNGISQFRFGQLLSNLNVILYAQFVLVPAIVSRAGSRDTDYVFIPKERLIS